MGEKIFKPIRVAFIGTYPPRQCGIATFTFDLATEVAKIMGESPLEGRQVQVLAVNNIFTGYKYGPEVCFEIREQQKMDYREAADFLNVSQNEVICLQHEYGIFGGKSGSHIINLLGNLKKPVVTTLHTILREPSEEQARVLKEVCLRSTLVVVQAQKAIELLVDIYGVPEEKIVFIPHGAPDVPFLDSSYYKDQFQAEGRRVLLSFGLLNPNKGIEVAIDAMSTVIKKFPDVIYVVLGATHPELKRRWGEAYRLWLEMLVKEKGLTEHIIFHNRFVSLEQLTKFLLMSDIYLTCSLSREQIVSGTMAYAVACGKAIISTPYWYAQEILAENRGLLVPFRDAGALADQLCDLLVNERELNALRRRAYQFGRQMVWREVANMYMETFTRALQEYGRLNLRPRIRGRAIPQPSLPEVQLDHLRLMTDETGILQHAIFTIPNRYHGYSTDDNARAVLVTVLNWHLFKDEAVLPLMQIYLSFLHHALNEETGRFRNFMSYDRRWLEEIGSEDCHGRALWALGATVNYAPNETILTFAARMFDLALPGCEFLTYARAWAYSLLGCIAYLKRFGGSSEARRIGEILARHLAELFSQNSSPDWPWAEEIVTYDNARLPQALITAGRWLNDSHLVELGLNSLEWLVQIQTDPHDGHLSPIGNKGWFPRGGTKAQFDQQPIEVAALVDACHEAYLATRQKIWFEKIYRCFNWFLGDNDVHEAVYDFSSTGCRDGIHSSGVNMNQGAESTLAWLLVLHRMHEITHENTIEADQQHDHIRCDC